MTDLIVLDPEAARDYLEETARLGRSVKITWENAESLVRGCHSRYNSLRSTLEDRVRQAERKLDELQARQRQQEPGADTSEMNRALAEYNAARYALDQLEHIWHQFYPAVHIHEQRLKDSYEYFCLRKRQADRELSRYCGIIQQIRQTVNSEGPGVGSSSRPAAPGWCSNHHITAVSVASSGTKHISMSIGGQKLQVPCDKAGIARACRTALKSGDADMIRITNAMFEVETFRESLELGAGHPNVPQLGGYHRDVKSQDPPGYESHHIPARSVQDRDAEWLPALSITDADHALTASYRGRQGKVYESVVPGGAGKDTYKEMVVNQIAQGETGYLHAMKCEILDLKDTTGSKYDGAISAFLDAVLDMMSTRGIPGELPIQSGK